MNRMKTLTVVLVIIGFVIPLGLYEALFFQVSEISVPQLMDRLHFSAADTSIVYINNSKAKQVRRLSSQIQLIHYNDLINVKSVTVLPESIQDKNLVLLCDGGLDAAHLYHTLQPLLQQQGKTVSVVRGGVQAIEANVDIQASPPKKQFFYRQISTIDQMASFVSAFVVKPLYMALSFILMVLLYLFKEKHLRPLLFAMVAFWVGEMFCFFNYLFFNEDSFVVELVHMYGMVLAFGFTTLWLLETMHRLVLGDSEGSVCVFRQVCGVCTRTETGCRLLRMYPPVIIFLIVMTVIPLMADYNMTAYVTTVLEYLYHYDQSVAYQVYEIRIAPVMAIGCFTGALILYWHGVQAFQSAIDILVALGVGHMGFSFLRMGFEAIFPNLIWFVVWEELTELLYIGCLIYILYLYYPGVFSVLRRRRT